MKGRTIKFEPRSTLKKKAQQFISCLYFIYEIKICVLVHARKDYATVEIYLKRHQNQSKVQSVHQFFIVCFEMTCIERLFWPLGRTLEVFVERLNTNQGFQ